MALILMRLNGKMKKTDWTQLEPRICEVCGTDYYHRPKEKACQFKQRKFCGIPCRMIALHCFTRGKKAHNNRQIVRTCTVCGKQEMIAPCHAKRPYCSVDCMSINMRSGKNSGENHWNWQGGITEKPSRDVLYPGYKEWRRKVFQRDGFRCTLCRSGKSGTLQAHHVKPRATHKDLILDVTNGMTVCIKCHKEIHYGTEIQNSI